MKVQIEIFKEVSDKLVNLSNQFEKLSLRKQGFGKQIHYQVKRLYQMIASQIGSKEKIQIDAFSQNYGIPQRQLLQVLFRQNNIESHQLSVERLCAFIKISNHNLKKTYASSQISKESLGKFIQIIKEEIRIRKQVREVFKIHLQNLQKIFEEIDFFNNKYVDVASLVQFFQHYSQGQQYSEHGCVKLIQTIKGSQFSAEKIFFQDLFDFTEEKSVIQQKTKKSDIQNKNQLVSGSLPSNLPMHSQYQQFQTSHIKNQLNPNLYRQSFGSQNMSRQSFNRQSISPQRSSSPSQIQYNMADLEISQSLSPKSERSRQDLIIENVFNKTYQCNNTNNSYKRSSDKTKHQLENTQKNDLVVENNPHKQYILIKDEHNIGSEQPKINFFDNKIKVPQFFSVPSSYSNVKQYVPGPQKSISHSKPKLLNSTFSKNDFQSQLIKTHSRNSAYLHQVKLMDSSSSKLYQSDRKSVNKKKLFNRECLNNKVSVFEQKKVQFVFALQLISQQYSRYYNAIEDLIQNNQKFTFINAFNAIDLQETNQVTLRQFKQFLKDCQIQKKLTKIQSFFEKFSIPFPKDSQNKQNRFLSSTKNNFENFIDQNQQDQRIMRFSDFLKIFRINKAAQILIKCKKRSPQINQKWDIKMKQSYCNFFRIILDTNHQIDQMHKSLRKIYLQMKQVWGFQTFEKTFEREIIRFDEIKKVIGVSSDALCWEISYEDEYIDEEKILRYLKIQSKQKYCSD